MRLRGFLLSSALLVAAPAYAQTRTIRLEPPSCASLPFTHERLSDLLAVELALQQMALVRGDADAVVQYDALDCGNAHGAVRVRIVRPDASEEIDLRNTRARSIALFIAELLREQPDLVDAPAPLLASTAAIALPDVPLSVISPREELDRPIEPAFDDERPPADAPRSNERRMEDAFILAGVQTLEVLWSPWTSAYLVGGRTEFQARMPFWRHLRIHLDVGFMGGEGDSTNWNTDIGIASAGFMTGIAIGGPDISVELAPRIAIAFAWAFNLGGADYLSEAIMFTVGGVVRGAFRMSGAWSLVLEAEVGAPATGRVAFQRFEAFDRIVQGGGIDGPLVAFRAGVMID